MILVFQLIFNVNDFKITLHYESPCLYLIKNKKEVIL